jgi:hypothetical protein
VETTITSAHQQDEVAQNPAQPGFLQRLLRVSSQCHKWVDKQCELDKAKAQAPDPLSSDQIPPPYSADQVQTPAFSSPEESPLIQMLAPN